MFLYPRNDFIKIVLGVRGQCIRYAPTKCRRAVLWPFAYRAARSCRQFLAPPQMFISCLYCGGAAHGLAHDEPRNGMTAGRTGGRGPAPKIFDISGVRGRQSPRQTQKNFIGVTWSGGAMLVYFVHGGPAARLIGA